MSDESELSDLMKRAQGGDAQAYGRLLTRIEGLMGRFVENALRRAGLTIAGTSDDVVQEILLAVHNHRANYNPGQNFLPWLYAIARHKVIDHLRRQKVNRRMIQLDTEMESLLVTSNDELGAGLDLENLKKFLPEKQWQVLHMVKIQELSIRSVSEQTGYSESDVKVTVHRALENLRRHVKEMS